MRHAMATTMLTVALFIVFALAGCAGNPTPAKSYATARVTLTAAEKAAFILQDMGALEGEEFIAFGETALQASKALAAAKEAFEAGNDPSFVSWLDLAESLLTQLAAVEHEKQLELVKGSAP